MHLMCETPHYKVMWLWHALRGAAFPSEPPGTDSAAPAESVVGPGWLSSFTSSCEAAPLRRPDEQWNVTHMLGTHAPFIGWDRC